MTDKQLLEQALEALQEVYWSSRSAKHDEAITAIQARLEQPEQEPVAWRYRSVSPFADKDGFYKVRDAWTLIHKPDLRDAHSAICGSPVEPLYITPPVAQRQWVGLTVEEALTEAARHLGEMHVENCGLGDIKDFAKAIEAKLKEKNA